ncbi:diaminopimelate decarboxylase [Leucobacter sp. UCMA 4100]|uniref:diaminopimelate decarboxylase n=1 Tax=Leucobacter sp. UCMA 4100 TaxID=2810534 RepID=UPI0022EB2C51|nr:diaminopimelate decarboxylase [Leucobacter sp. UCMA 4100]MDA3147774.1 diaminopimelate decarboxylase [Leucobacter sp. UCMA 4100]
MSDTSLPPSLARLLPSTAGIDDTGALTIGGCSVTDLAGRFGTPLFVYDELHLRETMRRYREGLRSRWPKSRVCFASKSLPCIAAYAIAEAEGLSVDVAGEGELRMALAAGVTAANIVLHGNAKSSAEINLATKVGVGLIVIDNDHDVALIEEHATTPQDVLIRVLPGVEADTHPSIQTGGTHSKFGMPIEAALALIRRIEGSERVRVRGVHVHIGSQILDVEPFLEALRVIANVGSFDVYNLGGGLGVNYSEADDAPEIEEYLDGLCGLAATVLPDDVELIIEPGRSLVARSGITAYTVRTVKRSLETFVAVDGGMSELMNIALTDDRFTAVVADRVTEAPDTLVQLVGRQCESGDLLVDRAPLHAPAPGDTVIIAATGAYGYTFANNYNGALHPAVVFCRDEEATLAVRRQTYEGYLEAHEPALEHDWTRLPVLTSQKS